MHTVGVIFDNDELWTPKGAVTSTEGHGKVFMADDVSAVLDALLTRRRQVGES